MATGEKRKGRPPLTNKVSSRSGNALHQTRLTTSLGLALPPDEDIDSDMIGETWRTAITDFQKTMEHALSKIQESFIKLESDLNIAIEFQSDRIDILETKMAAKDKFCDDLLQRISVLENAASSAAIHNNKNERMSRRNNFRIVGIPFNDNEVCDDIITSTIFPPFGDTGDLDVTIERCHRDGKGYNGHPPHILVRCLSYKTKVFIMKNRRSALEGKPFFIVDDLSKVDLAEKKKWAKEVKDLYSKGTKLRFVGGKWRNASGTPYDFSSA